MQLNASYLEDDTTTCPSESCDDADSTSGDTVPYSDVELGLGSPRGVDGEKLPWHLNELQRNFFKNPEQFRSPFFKSPAKAAIALIGGVTEEHVTKIQRMRIVTFRDKDGVPDPTRSIHLECVGVIMEMLGDAPGSGDGYFTRVALRCEAEKNIRKPVLWLLSTPSFWNGMCKAVADRWFEQDGTPKFSGEVGMYSWDDGTMTSVCKSRENLLEMPEP